MSFPEEEKRLLDVGLVSPQWIQWLSIIRIMKMPGGPEILQKVLHDWLQSQTQIMRALAESGSGNIIVAWAHSHIIAMMLEQNYMIRKGGAAGIMDGLNKLTGTITLAEIFGQIAVPSVLAFSGVPISKPGSLKGLLK